MTMEVCAEGLRVILAFWPLAKEYLEYADVRFDLFALPAAHYNAQLVERLICECGFLLQYILRCSRRVSLLV